MHQLGFENTVALMGDQPSIGQLDLLKLLSHKIILALDNDVPGMDATRRIGRFLQLRGHEVFTLNYEGKDPGELQEVGSFEQRPYLSYLLERQTTEGLVYGKV